LLVGDLHALDAAVALVEQGEVVGEAVGDGNAVGRIGAGAVDEGRDVEPVLRRSSRYCPRRCKRGSGEGADLEISQGHLDLPMELSKLVGRHGTAARGAATALS